MSIDNYEKAQADHVAAIILNALHKQDAATYNGDSGDMGGLALSTAAAIRKALMPRSVVDSDGDVWTREGDSDLYGTSGLRSRTLAEIQADYGLRGTNP